MLSTFRNSGLPSIWATPAEALKGQDLCILMSIDIDWREILSNICPTFKVDFSSLSNFCLVYADVLSSSGCGSPNRTDGPCLTCLGKAVRGHTPDSFRIGATRL